MSELAHRPDNLPAHRPEKGLARIPDTQPSYKGKSDVAETVFAVTGFISVVLLLISPVGWLLGFSPLWLAGAGGGLALGVFLLVFVWGGVEGIRMGDDYEQD